MQSAFDALGEVAQHGQWMALHFGELRESWLARGQGATRGAWIPGFEYQDVPPDEADADRRNALLAVRQAAFTGRGSEHTLKSLCHHRDSFAWEMRDWRGSLVRARAALPPLSKHMDEPGVPTVSRWTSRVRGLLAEIGGCVSATRHWRTLPPIEDDSWTVALSTKSAALLAMAEDLKAIGEEQAVPPTHAPAAEAKQAQLSAGPPLPTDSPTMRDLATAAGIGDDTFRRVRKAAKLAPGPTGAAGRNRRYGPVEVDRLVQGALRGNFIERRGMAVKWAKWSSAPNTLTPQVGRK